jgi:protein-S-isoprenylcysteine O-methyltransferase Ste14
MSCASDGGHDAVGELTGSFIALCWGVFLAFIVASAFSAKRAVQRDRRWTYGWVALVALVAAFLVVRRAPYLSTFLDRTLHRSSTPLLSLCADAIALAGLVVALWGRIELGRNWSLNPSIQEDHELIERGPYVYVRHPMYSGLVLMLLGAVLWQGSWLGGAFFIICLVGTWLKLRQEERLLTEHFGESYLKYKARVKALIPFLL